MVVLGLVKRVEEAKIVSDGAGVVTDNVDHDPHTLGVGGVNEGLEVALGTEVRVYSFPIASPVSVVSAIDVVHNWRYPNGVETHAFDVIKMLNHTLVVTTAVV